MYLSRFKISNHKCFNSTAELILKPGLNLIVGKNNSGKSTLLNALSMNAPAIAHHHFSENNVVSGEGSPAAAEFRFVFTATELSKIPVGNQQSFVAVPLPDPTSDLATRIGFTDQSESSLANFSHWLRTAELEILIQMNGSALGSIGFSAPLGLDGRGGRKWWDIRAALKGEAQPLLAEGNAQALLNQLATSLKGRFRYVSASRGNTQQPAIGQRVDRLAPDGNNIVGLLDSLQRKGRRAERFVNLVSQVLPAIQHISVRTLQSNTGEVALWEHGAETEQDELAPSLANSGTGVRHILIMLLLTFCEPEPAIIVIDELEHSLHPGAIRELLHIFTTTFSDNQFVIGTHSPTAVASGIPATVSVIKKTVGESTIQFMDRDKLQVTREALAEIGASVSDLFGADAVLWVEGATEEICFQRIVDKLSSRETPGAVVIKGVVQTGDLGTRDAERVLRIYEKLSGADALLPPAIGFILDDEGRSTQQKEDLTRRSHGRMRFLRRCVYENYLLHPEAIAAVFSSIEGVPKISSGTVSDWLDKHNQDTKYRGMDVPGADWKITVHAGKLLKDLFSQLSEQTATYRKPEHSVALTEWLLDKDPDFLKDVGELIQDSVRPCKPVEVTKAGTGREISANVNA